MLRGNIFSVLAKVATRGAKYKRLFNNIGFKSVARLLVHRCSTAFTLVSTPQLLDEVFAFVAEFEGEFFLYYPLWWGQPHAREEP